MRTSRLLWLSVAAIMGLAPGFAALSFAADDSKDSKAISPEAADFFEKKVRPVLVEKCYTCHSDSQQLSGLRLDSRANLLKGGKRGPALVPGEPEQSAMIRAIRYDGALKMPPTGKLGPEVIADLTAWVKMGAPWPEAKPNAFPTFPKYVITPEKRNFWSFHPVKNPPIPLVKNKAWVKSPIDAFILAKLEAKGLPPAPPADKRTLLRRATFDLTGLPPAPAEVNAFLADKSPNAFAKVVDRLLASPRYGERWGRYWLDVVRYTDSTDARGVGSEGDVAFAWRYRDWVVNAFNQDMPYDQFMLNQVAGDLLPAKTPGEANIPGIIATGMLAIGNWGNGDADKEKILTDIADDQVDVVSRGFMGLTVACARCHHHKFDPIATQDYYGLAGIFFSTHILPKLTPKGAGENMLRIPLASKEELAKRDKFAAELADLEKRESVARNAAVSDFARGLLPQTARYMVAAWDYRNRPGDQANVSLADFAAKQGLQTYAVRQWMDTLGMGDYRLMTIPIKDLAGNTGVYGFRGDPDPPSLVVNTNPDPRAITTLTLPGRSVCVHPGTTYGVAVGWRSPITGTVKVTGRVADADPNGGDGIAWVIDHRIAGTTHALASGDFPNTGKQDFAQGKDAQNLNAISVHAGDSLELVVLPKANYTCDTTIVELTIATPDGARVWNLRDDIIDDLLSKGNPHPDHYGNPGVWRFYDMQGSRRNETQTGAGANPRLAQWDKAVAGVSSGAADHTALVAAAEAFAKTFTTVDKSSPFWIANKEDEKALPPDAQTTLAKLAADLNALRKQTPPPLEYANGAQDGGCPESPQAGFHDVRVHIRGSYLRLADMVPRHFPVILAGENQPPITQGSGRLQLGRWLGNPNHPTTARVMVNRIWQHHFGEGIVRTPSNFGFLGERPTHPELLDWLAWQFVHRGWSIKKMHRIIMLSASYQQASESSAQAMRIDPDNRLFGRMNRRRLESEAIRDNLLAVSGKLNTTMGGVATRDFSEPRRTLYIMTIRSDRTGFGPLFDVADSTASVDHRVASTVAPQALFLLNDPFVIAQTKALAARLLREVPNDDRARIQAAYPLLYGRPASAEEIKIGLAYLARARQTLNPKIAGTNAPNMDTLAWEAYCQILLCANEFIYID